MRIDAFKSLIQQGATGRISASGNDDQVQSASQRLGGKAVGVVKDFFARFSSAGRMAQQQENQAVNQQLRQALVASYGDRVPAKLLEKLQNNPTKPITVSDVRKVIDQIETSRPTAVTVSLPGSGTRVELSPSTFPRAALSKIPDLQGLVQQKIDRGHDLVTGLLDGTRGLDPAATQQDVTDIAWFLHITAEAKNGDPFSSGALTVSDGNQTLRKFLDSCPESYQRASSHIGGFKESAGGQHRGIDVPTGQGVDSLLPHGRTTMLYGSMIANDNTPIPDTMLFFKLESHGCRLSAPKESVRDADHQDRPVRLGHDISDFIGHTLSFISGMKARSSGEHAADSRKERLPADIKKAFKELVDAAPPGLRDVLMKNDPMAKAAGIRVMMANIDEARRLQDDNRDQMGMFNVDLNTGTSTSVYDPAMHTGTNFLVPTAFETMVTDRYGNGPDLKYRIGNEIILLRNELG